MLEWRSRNAPWYCLLIVSVGGGAALITGCSTPSFHSSSSNESSSMTQVNGDELEADDRSEWPGSSKSGDAERQSQYHEVKPGETLAGLARMYGVTVSQLANANSGVDAADRLKPGHILLIPQPR